MLFMYIFMYIFRTLLYDLPTPRDACLVPYAMPVSRVPPLVPLARVRVRVL